ncbi:MAG: aminotransferase class III-fold pyridoxal phosphate-dependent enzyme [Oligoflexia bacterium]|nr:aminotransferase class III-fold pyridoxal phosphate-dependent enzyme [Oligoflexia bacterium]MBF0364610.1 aminotransferase class III-fold pyridoxal phosphate-dependent enzyme [Oligoflexia bacterium]
MVESKKLKLERSEQLYKEAWELFPGAVAGIRRPYNFVPGEYPIFFDRASGGKVIDVDGNEYIDMLCAYGPIIIGHREKEIDDAVVAHLRDHGFCMSLTQEIQLKLGYRLRELIPSCEKLVFVKTGSDATSVAIRVSRAFTGKTKVLRCGYHGWHDWCVEVKGGVPQKLYEDVFEFHYNNLNELEELLNKHRGEVAAVIVTPVGHPLADEVQMPAPGFLEGVKSLCKKHESVLVFDEIRSGFRVNLGGAQKEFGVTPDLSVFGKAMANGYPISAVVGRKEVMDVLVDKAFLSSTFFPNSLEMVAALKNIEILERERVLDKIKERGNRFAAKVSKITKESGIDCTVSGAPWMPFITFNRDAKKLYKEMRVQFYTELIRRKVFLQPYHHGYIAYRHEERDLDYAAEMIAESLAATKEKF